MDFDEEKARQAINEHVAQYGRPVPWSDLEEIIVISSDDEDEAVEEERSAHSCPRANTLGQEESEENKDREENGNEDGGNDVRSISSDTESGSESDGSGSESNSMIPRWESDSDIWLSDISTGSDSVFDWPLELSGGQGERQQQEQGEGRRGRKRRYGEWLKGQKPICI